MKVEKHTIKVEDLYKNFTDEGENGAVGYDEQLNIRPKYQREFCYNDKQQEAVIHSVLNGFPINVMYWIRRELEEGEEDDGIRYELLDGQQRTLSICRFIKGKYKIKIDGKPLYFNNLTKDEKAKILEYELDVYICDGTDKERLDWFRVINTAGEKLTPQELRNATYSGPWVESAKKTFSKTGCYAVNKGGNYIKGDSIRQEIFETVLKWAAEADGLTGNDAIETYMAKHQHDEDAEELKEYFEDIIDWIEEVFPEYNRLMKGLDWGRLYNKYHNRVYDEEKMAKEVKRLMADEEIGKKKHIYEYLLDGGADGKLEKILSLRQFSEDDKVTMYEKQDHKCAICGKNIKDIKDARADHIKAWAKGGRTVISDDPAKNNGQVLCEKCNIAKSSKDL